MNVPQGLFFTKEHEWVKIEGTVCRMGITDYAQSSLGDITFVELPNKGAQIKQFAQIATVESVKAASDVYAPLSGTVTEINEGVVKNPELVNQSPYEQAWFVAMEIADTAEKNNLMDARQYEDYLKKTAH